MYVLLDEAVLGPERAHRPEYRPARKPARGDEAVLVGLQVEKSQRHELKVRADTS
jgi:hypothetical protein